LTGGEGETIKSSGNGGESGNQFNRKVRRVFSCSAGKEFYSPVAHAPCRGEPKGRKKVKGGEEKRRKGEDV